MKPLHPLFAGRRPTLHIAHRGGAALAPENTLAAFRAAVEHWRTDMLELDVHFSRDGEAWVSHDPTVDRCTDGSGAIAELDSAALAGLDAGHRFTRDGATFPFRGTGVRLPRLVDVLAAFPTHLFNLDLKVNTAAAAEALAPLLRPALGRVCVGAEWDERAAHLAALLPGGCLFYPREALTAFVICALNGEPPPEDERYAVLDMPLAYEEMRVVTPALLAEARAGGKWVNVWTIDDPAQMRRLIADGVGGIMTDRPDLLREVLGGS